MPQPKPPPTPASSTEIKGQDGSQFSSLLQMSFELPPPAVAGSESRSSNLLPSKPSSASSYHPASSPSNSPAIPASEAVKVRRRSSMTQAPSKDAFALPPPPTRSRKIIQMKPRAQQDEVEAESINDVSKSPVGKTSTPASKKRQPSSTSVAGRKIARKTAHSLIERRRRSKMNEEFGVLKDMIPACTGEMHKLAILQASIDYVRYLEDCVAKLKAENNRNTTTYTSSPPFEQFALPASAASRSSYQAHNQATLFDEDTEMNESPATSPTYSTSIPLPSQPPSHSHSTTASPSLRPYDSITHHHQQRDRTRQDSYSSATTGTEHRHYSFSGTSANTSPALRPAAYECVMGGTSVGSLLTSPALRPLRDELRERDLDSEVTAALLMLNADRRGRGGNGSGHGSNGSNGGVGAGESRKGSGSGSGSGIGGRTGGGRGMSVKDLLST